MEQQARSWSHLDDLCLLLIFKKLPVSDMIRSVGRVCTNWARLQRDDLRSRNTLVIADKNQEVSDYENPFGSSLIEHVGREDGLPWTLVRTHEQIEFDALRVPGCDSLSERFTTPLMNILPNITHFTLEILFPFHLTIPVLEQVTHLINYYSASLVSLRLEIIKTYNISFSRLVQCRIDNNPHINPMLPLFNSINRLESLRHLRLNIDTRDSYPELSILSRLTTFTSGGFYPLQPLLASLRQYATGDDLRVECDTGIGQNELNRLDSQLATKFIRARVLSPIDSPTDYENVQLFCARFISLHSLCLNIWTISMNKLTRCLSQLSQLIHLKLDFLQIITEEATPQLDIIPVSSVRLLTLTIWPKSHLETESLRLAQIFPNLQVLHLIHNLGSCNLCNYDSVLINSPIEPDVRARIMDCLRLARQPFSQCANLHTVKLDTDKKDLQSLLPPGLITRDEL